MDDKEYLNNNEEVISGTDAEEFLNELRESGVTNMFGATPYIEERFDCNARTSKQILKDWMLSFGR